MKKILPMLLIPLFVYASFEPGRLPPAFIGLGSSGIASNQSLFFPNNPALIVFCSRPAFNLQYRNFYSIPQLNEFALSFQKKLKFLPVGMFISQFGDKRYQESQLSLSLAHTLFKRLSLGLQLHSYYLHIKNYGNYQAFGLSLGLHLKVSSFLSIAGVFGNFNEPKFKNNYGKLPVYFTSGLAFQLLPQAQLSLDIFKDELFDFDYRIGLKYQLFKMISFLFGFRQQVHTFSTGIIFKRKIFSFCYALEYHPSLGVSNAVSVAYFL